MSDVSMLDEKAHKCKWNGTADECAYLDPVMTVEVSESIPLSLVRSLCVIIWKHVCMF
jgi:hypothetical protein